MQKGEEKSINCKKWELKKNDAAQRDHKNKMDKKDKEIKALKTKISEWEAYSSDLEAEISELKLKALDWEDYATHIQAKLTEAIKRFGSTEGGISKAILTLPSTMVVDGKALLAMATGNILVCKSRPFANPKFCGRSMSPLSPPLRKIRHDEQKSEEAVSFLVSKAPLAKVPGNILVCKARPSANPKFCGRSRSPLSPPLRKMRQDEKKSAEGREFWWF
jgi:hypothetical protein